MNGVPILLYHAVDDVVDPRFAEWAVSAHAFGEQLDLLASLGYTTLTVSDFVNRVFDDGGPLPARPALVTFDDGFADFHDAALPRLVERDMRATVFVTTGYVGSTSRWLEDVGESGRPMMSWDQVAHLADAGIECGGHSQTHPQLDTVPIRVAVREIERCRADLERVVGPVDAFAYPHGYRNRRVARAVREAGFRSACGVDDMIFQPPGDRHGIQRLVVRGGMGIEDLERAFSRTGRRRSRLKPAAWRALRRVGADRLAR